MIEKLNINAWMYYLTEHPDVSMLLTILFPVFCGICYYVSYLISVRKFVKREDWLDD